MKAHSFIADHRDEIQTEAAYRALEMHLTAVSHFEQQLEAEKVIQHMNSFLILLDHQRDHNMITPGLYDLLEQQTWSILNRWE